MKWIKLLIIVLSLSLPIHSYACWDEDWDDDWWNNDDYGEDWWNGDDGESWWNGDDDDDWGNDDGNDFDDWNGFGKDDDVVGGMLPEVEVLFQTMMTIMGLIMTGGEEIMMTILLMTTVMMIGGMMTTMSGLGQIQMIRKIQMHLIIGKIRLGISQLIMSIFLIGRNGKIIQSIGNRKMGKIAYQ